MLKRQYAVTILVEVKASTKAALDEAEQDLKLTPPVRHGRSWSTRGSYTLESTGLAIDGLKRLCPSEVERLRDELALALARAEKAEAQVTALLDDGMMACESPCGDCAGCLYADERAEAGTL